MEIEIEEPSISEEFINIEEIRWYITTNPNFISIFCNKDFPITVRYKYDLNTQMYRCNEITYFNKDITHSAGSRCHELYCTWYPKHESIKLFVTEYNYCNCDLLTIFSVLTHRTADKFMAKHICITIFKNNCSILQNEILWLYLYENSIALDIKRQISPRAYNPELLTLWQTEIVDKLSNL